MPLYIKSADFFFLFNVMFCPPCLMDVHVICRFFCTTSMTVLFVGWLFWKVWTDDCSFSFFFRCVLCHWLLKILFDRKWLGIHCVTTAEISKVGIIFVCISWNIWSRNYFCLLYTFSGCFFALFNWAILQRRLLYANQVLYCMFSHVIGHWAYRFFGMVLQAACNFPAYELLFIRMAFCLFILL